MVLREMISSMKHREEYIVDTYVDDKVALGRISLGTLNRDPQPCRSLDDRYHLFMDGRIFDYNELKTRLKKEGCRFSQHSEEEFVVSLFSKMGGETAGHLKGIFLAVVYDSKTNTLYIFNDRYGLKHLYYFSNPRVFVFASEIKAILKTNEVEKEIDESAISDLYLLHWIIGDRTLFKRIKLFPYACVMKVDTDGEEISEYWDFPHQNERSTASTEEYIEQGRHLMRQAVHRQFRKDLKIGVTLSGGLDSRTISGFAREIDSRLRCFHAGEPNWYETRIAKNVCRRLGNRLVVHDQTRIDYSTLLPEGLHLLDAQVHCNQVWLLDLIKRIAKDFEENYILDGLGQDALLRPKRFIEEDRSYPSLADRIALVRKVSPFMHPRVAELIFTKGSVPRLYALSEENEGIHISKFQGTSFNELVQYYFMTTMGRRYAWTPPVLHSAYIETGFPGADYDFFDFCVRLPSRLRVQANLYRKIFLSAFPALASVPWALTQIPPKAYENVWSKLKQRCRRYEYYLNRLTGGKLELGNSTWNLNYRFRRDRQFREYFLGLLYDKRTYSRGYVDRKGIDNLVRLQDSGRNYFMHLQSIITVEMFYRQFID